MLKVNIYALTRKYLDSLGPLQGKVVVDVPAGTGAMSSEFTKRGANVIALDLYPEKVQGNVAEKHYADMNQRLPLGDEIADYVLCQEGIEHISNQVGFMEEINRILKPGGMLLITTPSTSHVRARLSMLLVESEYWKRLPASEVDSVWFSEQHSDRIYYGHFFLLNANQLRAIAALTGFKIHKRLRTSITISSLLLLTVLYPLITLSTLLALLDSYRKNRTGWSEIKSNIYREQVKINLSPITLLCKDFFWVFEKNLSVKNARTELKSYSRF